MHRFPPLESLGPRIAICGPSNSGKSTLAVALGDRLACPAIHLDQLHHIPGTDWQKRPDAEFAALHAQAIAGENWVMDGNYSRLQAARWQRATAIVLLGSDRWSAFYRYLRRTLFERDRAGALDGGKDSVKWLMVHWILVVQPRRAKAWRTDLRQTGLPVVEVKSMRELNALYAAWGLTRA